MSDNLGFKMEQSNSSNCKCLMCLAFTQSFETCKTCSYNNENNYKVKKHYLTLILIKQLLR